MVPTPLILSEIINSNGNSSGLPYLHLYLVLENRVSGFLKVINPVFIRKLVFNSKQPELYPKNRFETSFSDNPISGLVKVHYLPLPYFYYTYFYYRERCKTWKGPANTLGERLNARTVLPG